MFYYCDVAMVPVGVAMLQVLLPWGLSCFCGDSVKVSFLTVALILLYQKTIDCCA